MHTNTLNERVQVRHPMPVLSKLTVIGLLGAAIAYAALLALIGRVIVPVLVMAILMLLVAGIVSTGRYWMPLFGGLWMIISLTAALIFAPGYTLYHMAHPGDLAFFTVFVLLVASVVLGATAGIGATVQNYRGIRSAPHWLPAALGTLGGIIIGALLVAGIVASTASATPATATTSSTPEAHMGPGNFVQSNISVQRGAQLRLVDDAAFPHVIANGAWDTHQVAQPVVETGAPTANKVTTNGAPIILGPFDVAGTFHFYCTIHPGMNLTVVVQGK